MSAGLSTTLDLSRATPARAALPNLTGLTREALRLALVEAGVAAPDKAKMRAGCMWRWIHHHGVTDFAAMSNIDKETRAAMAERCRPGAARDILAAPAEQGWRHQG